MKKILLLRHGETTAIGKYIGSTDVALSVKGQSHISSRKSELQADKISKVFCSPMQRCVNTLDLLCLQTPAEVDERIREIDFGLWEKKNFKEIQKLYPEDVAKWAEGKNDFCFPEGESLASFHNRINDFSKEISNCDADTILIVSHGGVIRHLICILLNLPLKNYLLFRIDYGKLTCIDLYDNGGVLTGLNR